MTEKSSAEYSNDIDKANEELKKLITDHQTVEQGKLQLQRDIIALQLKKKDLEMILSKSLLNIRAKNIDIKDLTSKFWKCRNSGL